MGLAIASPCRAHTRDLLGAQLAGPPTRGLPAGPVIIPGLAPVTAGFLAPQPGGPIPGKGQS